MEYRTIRKEGTVETVLSKSRFIAYTEPMSSELDAPKLLAALKKTHPFATHICYAYIADESGLVQKFSDDGEPKGTAGLPMLEVLKKRGARRVFTAVVRYYGGIKLGAGGLVRAYSQSVADVLDAVGIVTMREHTLYTLRLDFASADRVRAMTEEVGRDYGDDVTITFAVAGVDAYTRLLERLSAALQRKVELTMCGTTYFACEE